MSELIATRESFGKGLIEIDNKNIVVLDADVDSSTKTSYFRKEHTDRFVEIGIAEEDMIGTAAGLATCGKVAIASTFAAFATGRCYDQIRASVAYPKLNVKIVGTHSGVTVGEDGATHQMLEDINLMRGLPNMVVLNPADDVSTRALLKNAIEYKGPVYLRLSRRPTKVIYNCFDEMYIDDTKIKQENNNFVSFNNIENDFENTGNKKGNKATIEENFKIGKGIQIGKRM